MIIDELMTFRVLACSGVPERRPIPTRTRLVYEPAQPWTVTLTFNESSGQPVKWTVGREILARGLREHAGLMDVKVWPATPGMVYMQLSSVDDSCLFEVSCSLLERFLARTYAAVPAGTEPRHMSVDKALKNLLAEA